MDIQWYPGHMAKSRRQISEKLKLINVAVIAIDARAKEHAQPRSAGAAFGQGVYRGIE